MALVIWGVFILISPLTFHFKKTGMGKADGLFISAVLLIWMSPSLKYVLKSVSGGKT